MASYGRPRVTFDSHYTLFAVISLIHYHTLKTMTWHASSCSQQAPQGHTSMASYGRPSLPFASLYTIQTIPQSQINSFFSAFKLAVYHLSLSQRRP
jgi:hypothetical protein